MDRFWYIFLYSILYTIYILYVTKTEERRKKVEEKNTQQRIYVFLVDFVVADVNALLTNVLQYNILDNLHFFFHFYIYI